MNNKQLSWKPFLTSYIIIILIVVLTIFCYWHIKGHQFLGFDDPVYVTDNTYVKNGLSFENIKWAFSFNNITYWHPLTWLSHMLDCQIFGLKPAPHLFINLILHIFNAILLFLIILRMTGAQIKAAFVALLFALHPLNVESVAWLAERKTVLSTLFLFGAIYTYLHYTEKKKEWEYALILCLYAFGLMSKPSILIFPILLLLLDYRPLKRYAENYLGDEVSHFSPVKRFIFFCKANKYIILEKIPFFLLSLVSVIITIISLRYHRAIITQQNVPIIIRIYNFFISIIQYLKNIAWPVELSIYYPFPKKIIVLYFLMALSAVVLITIIAFITRKKRPWVIIGWLWFLIALMPASGLIQAGLWPAIANRFMYIPMIGIFIILIWEADERLRGNYSQVLKTILYSAMIIYFAFLSRYQLVYYSNNFAVFKRCLEVAGDNETAFNNLGNSFVSLGKIDEAMDYFSKSIKYNPRYYLAYYNYGVCLLWKKDDERARGYFQKAISLKPDHVESYINLSLIQRRAGKNNEAFAWIKKALNIDENNFKVRYSYGELLAEQGRFKEAIDNFLFVIKRDPGSVMARINLAQAYQDAGFYNQAISECETLAKTITHNKGYIYYGIAGVYSQQKKYKECVAYLEMAQNDDFNVLPYLKADKRFKNFRSTIYYTKFLKTNKIKIK